MQCNVYSGVRLKIFLIELVSHAMLQMTYANLAAKTEAQLAPLIVSQFERMVNCPNVHINSDQHKMKS